MEELSMEEYCVKIDELVLDLLVPARTEKKINIPVFEKFYGLLTELENKLRGEEYIPRKLAGLLYFIYKSLSAEAEHCSYEDELFSAAAKLGDMVDKILWDSPFKH